MPCPAAAYRIPWREVRRNRRDRCTAPAAGGGCGGSGSAARAATDALKTNANGINLRPALIVIRIVVTITATGAQYRRPLRVGRDLPELKLRQYGEDDCNARQQAARYHPSQRCARWWKRQRGRALPLPPKLSRLYGAFRLPVPRSGPLVFSNFVSTLDGVVSLQVKGHSGGGDISGFSGQDRMVMGLLRAAADAVIVGSGTLAADPEHLWTPQAICPELGDDYRRLSQSDGQAARGVECDRERRGIGRPAACRFSPPARSRC